MTTKEMLEKNDSFETRMLVDGVKELIATGVKNDNLTDFIAVLDELLGLVPSRIEVARWYRDNADKNDGYMHESYREYRKIVCFAECYLNPEMKAYLDEAERMVKRFNELCHEFCNSKVSYTEGNFLRILRDSK